MDASLFPLAFPLPGGRGGEAGLKVPWFDGDVIFLFSSLNGLGGGIIVWVYEAALFSAFAAE